MSEVFFGYKLHGWPGHPQPLVGCYQPDMRPVASRRYKLLQKYSVMLEKGDGEQARLTVIEGTVTDGASVPRIAWTASGLTPDGLLRAAALVHDWVYRNMGGLVLDFRDNQVNTGSVYVPSLARISKADADRIFLDLMLAAGVPEWRAKLAYRTVRIFGRRW